MEDAGVGFNPLQKLLPEFMTSNLPTNLLEKKNLGQYFNPGKMFTNFALNKMGLGWAVPVLGIASLLGFNRINEKVSQINQDFFAEKVLSSKNKEKMKKLGYEEYMKQRLSGKIDAYGNEITRAGRDAPENVVQASIQKFQPTQSQQDQMTEIMRKRMILQGYADKGALNERGQNTLAQMNQLINQYQVNPASIWT